MKLNEIGLDIEQSKQIVIKLNNLLSNFQVYYQNLRGVHWNIKGKEFFVLHPKFEELYTDAQEKVDMIAERILTLSGTPLHTFKDYMENAAVPIGRNVSKDEEAVKLIIASLTEIILIERIILELSDEANDEGTNSMMSDFISEQEKTIWMLKSWQG
ncbi:Dps family protein [Aureivirga marina]|uniref:Dps family protein n=1 Tax=Aureivirga marina TaxID=1182451 RepID=UPI0018CBC7F4|nr:Dps family protein [Aureivirga marina]